MTRPLAKYPSLPLGVSFRQVGVHIADVSHFVKPNTAIDDEAAARSTTVYLCDRRIDMLPPLLGTSTPFLESSLLQCGPDHRSVATDLCSLKPYVERLAFSVIWEMTTDAEIVDTFFTKSVIRSKAAFTYAEAQNRIDDLYASAVPFKFFTYPLTH